jgi:flagellar biosynthesis protein FlhA
MNDLSKQSELSGPATLGSLVARYRSLIVPLSVIAMLVVLVVPIPVWLIDVLLAANLTLAVIVLLTVIAADSPLEFSVFPSLLLGATLFRLVLNVATTRLILSADATNAAEATEAAGQVIHSFASFVAADSLVVGMVLFAILVIVQFVVITKGAGRISEVAARFTLDAMPGRQMAVDSDLNAGMIDQDEALRRRQEISSEADFYGAMDGASKFVRGDAIAAIIITLINIGGGIAIGVFDNGWSITQTAAVFTHLTIGDGLVSQLPALMLALAAGLIVTRSSQRQDLSTQLTQQLTGRASVLAVTALMLTVLAFTGLPMMPMLIMAAAVGWGAFIVHRKNKNRDEIAEGSSSGQIGQTSLAAGSKGAGAQNQTSDSYLELSELELQLGSALVSLVDPKQDGKLLQQLAAVRKQVAQELGLVIPPVNIRDEAELSPCAYQILLRGNPVGHGQLQLGQWFALCEQGQEIDALEGQLGHDPVFGVAGKWVEAKHCAQAKSRGCTVTSADNVLLAHFRQIVQTHAPELLTRQETVRLIDQLRQKAPSLVKQVIAPEAGSAGVSVALLHKVLSNLLAERVPIRDMEIIIQTLGDFAVRSSDPKLLTEYVRQALRRTICQQYVADSQDATALEFSASGSTYSGMGTSGGLPGGLPGAGGASGGALHCVALDPMLEHRIESYSARLSPENGLAMPASVAKRIIAALLLPLNRLMREGKPGVVLTSPQLRSAVAKLLKPHAPGLAVLSYAEVSENVQIQSAGLAAINEPDLGQRNLNPIQASRN